MLADHEFQGHTPKARHGKSAWLCRGKPRVENESKDEVLHA